MATIKASSKVINDQKEELTVNFTVTEDSTSVVNNTSTLKYSWTAVQKLPWGGATRNSGAELEFKINGSKVASATIPLTQGSGGGKTWSGSGTVTVTHDSNGKKTVSYEIIIGKGHGYANGYSQDNDPYVYAATSNSGTLALTNLDRVGPSITVGTNWISATRASIHFTSDCQLDRVRYKVGDNGAWETLADANTRDFNITGLTPNYTRNVSIEAKRKYNQVSRTGKVSVTTPKPSAPNKGTVSVSNVTPTSAKVSWSGFSFNEGADWGHYDFSQSGPDPFQNVGKDTSKIDSRLKPNTKYKWAIRLVDNYGTASDTSYSGEITTPKPPAPTLENFTVELYSPFIVNIFPGKSTFVGDYSKFDHYDFNIDDGPWQNGGTKAFSIRGLTPSKRYKFGLRVVDNYGTASVACYATVTMPFDQTKVWVNVDGKIQKAKVWACDSKGDIKKVKKIYVNVDGVVKHTKTV